jgi:heat shock protein HslJ
MKKNALLFTSLALAATTATGAAPADAELGNLAYRGIHDQPVTLQDGRHEGAPYVAEGAARPIVRLHPAPRLQVDLDGDGDAEAVVLLSQTSGGSGEYTHLAVVARRDGGAQNLSTVNLGDRVMLKRLEAQDARIVAEIVTAGPNEPACCPTQKTENVYELQDGALTRVSSRVLGNLSPADLAGAWRLVQIGTQAIPEQVVVTAEFTPGRIAGRGGCNRYFGAIAGSGANDLRIGPLGATQMACSEPAGSTETRFLSAMGRVTGIRFMLGRLALLATESGTAEMLLFERLK